MSGRVFATLMMEHVSIDTIFFIFGGVLRCYGTRGEVVSPTSRQFVLRLHYSLIAVLKGGLEHLNYPRIIMFCHWLFFSALLRPSLIFWRLPASTAL